MTKRVLKKVSTPFEQFRPDGAIVMINLVDPQLSTLRVFLDAVTEAGLPYFCVANKIDLVDEGELRRVADALGEEVDPSDHDPRSRDRPRRSANPAVVLSRRPNRRPGRIQQREDEPDRPPHRRDPRDQHLPGTTLEFEAHPYGAYTLIDTVGQVIDVSKPMMVSVDLSGCATRREKLARVLRQDAEGILATLETALPGLEQVVEVLRRAIDTGHKVVATGAGASALVAMEMAGQGTETGVPILVFTNNFADAQPVTFAKGLGEEEGGLARYMTTAVNPGDVVVGISASGGTGFVYDALAKARAKGATTVAITENVDTPLGHAADYVIKSNAKPEGPSSSKIQAAHLAIVHALLITLADERGITADESIALMMPEPVATKKMGIK